MSTDLHARALQLIDKDRVEGLSSSERAWLDAHLHDCAACTEFAHLTNVSVRSLRAAPIALPSGLATRTQFRVSLRAQELREGAPKRRALWLACGLSWIFGVANAPYIWSLFQWLGHRTGTPKLVWEIGFGLWWTVPALFAAVVFLMESSRKGEPSDWVSQGN